MIAETLIKRSCDMEALKALSEAFPDSYRRNLQKCFHPTGVTSSMRSDSVIAIYEDYSEASEAYDDLRKNLKFPRREKSWLD